MKRASQSLLNSDALSYLYSANLKDMPAKIDRSYLIGKQFTYYTIVNYINTRRVECQCKCGVLKTVTYYDLIKKKCRSCGCLRAEELTLKNITHGLTRHPLYRVYNNMLSRCCNPKCSQFKDYGGRGIAVCEEWLNDNQSFFNWAKDKWRMGLFLDRINNDKGYSPDNCRFTTRKVNSRNTRSNVFYYYNGENKTLPEWCEVLSLKYSTMAQRIYNQKLSAQEAFERPIRNLKH